ncbi:MAG: response regulator [Lachnospiraceae bacterium]|nr:response regulator [Lachnospiraceae bacterium]MCM1240396.1 response regulator [Lachnospiraceae bacterium]
MNIGKQILSLRKKRGITQETLAAEMGVTVGAVSKWETGSTLPDITMLCALADFFRITTDELLDRVGRETFMICDDAEFLRSCLKEILEKEGYHCKGSVKNSKELWAAMSKNIPQVLFLDIHFPDENGFDILKQINEKYPSVKVIMVTADNSEAALQTALRYNVSGYVTKPFQSEHILLALKKLQDRSA